MAKKEKFNVNWGGGSGGVGGNRGEVERALKGKRRCRICQPSKLQMDD